MDSVLLYNVWIYLWFWMWGLAFVSWVATTRKSDVVSTEPCYFKHPKTKSRFVIIEYIIFLGLMNQSYLTFAIRWRNDDNIGVSNAKYCSIRTLIYHWPRLINSVYGQLGRFACSLLEQTCRRKEIYSNYGVSVIKTINEFKQCLCCWYKEF